MIRILLVCLLATTAITLSGCGTDSPVPASEANTTNNLLQENAVTVSDKPTTNDSQPESSGEPEAKTTGNNVRQDEPATSSSPQVEIEEITFDDLNCGMQADVKFRPFMLTDRATELDGKRVQITGYMLPDLKQKRITEFVLLKNNECKFGPGGQADHLIMIKLRDGVTTDFKGTEKVYAVTGTLMIKPYEGPGGITYGIYEMAGESVKIRAR